MGKTIETKFNVGDVVRQTTCHERVGVIADITFDGQTVGYHIHCSSIGLASPKQEYVGIDEKGVEPMGVAMELKLKLQNVGAMEAEYAYTIGWGLEAIERTVRIPLKNVVLTPEQEEKCRLANE